MNGKVTPLFVSSAPLRSHIGASLGGYIMLRHEMAAIGDHAGSGIGATICRQAGFGRLSRIASMRAVSSLAKAADEGLTVASLAMAFTANVAHVLRAAETDPGLRCRHKVSVETLQDLKRHVDAFPVQDGDYPSAETIDAGLAAGLEFLDRSGMAAAPLRAAGMSLTAGRLVFDSLRHSLGQAAMAGLTVGALVREIGREAGAVPSAIENGKVYASGVAGLDDRRAIAIVSELRADGAAWCSFTQHLERGFPFAMIHAMPKHASLEHTMDACAHGRISVARKLVSAHEAGFGAADLLRTAVWTTMMKFDGAAGDPMQWQDMLDDLDLPKGKVVKDLIAPAVALGLTADFGATVEAYRDLVDETTRCVEAGVTLTDMVAFLWLRDLVEDVHAGVQEHLEDEGMLLEASA